MAYHDGNGYVSKSDQEEQIENVLKPSPSQYLSRAL